MQVRCPKCQTSVDLKTSGTDVEMECHACGESFEPQSILLNDEADSNETADVRLESSVHAMSAGDRIAKYSVLKLVGKGGFGAVYLAFDTQLERNVAIKLPRVGRMTTGQVEMFVREARIAAQVNNPNIVSVYEIGTHDEMAYIVTDFIDGKSLSAWRQEAQPDYRESVELCITISRALHEAHEKGIVHRDLKPGNILVDKAGIPYITDFGLAKRSVTDDETIAGRGDILGTPAYMSPEQACGESYLSDRRSDIYSLSVVLFELLTGRSPYQSSGSDLLQFVREAQTASVNELAPAVPRPITEVCEAGLSYRPENRPQSAKVFADRLQAALDGENSLRSIVTLERVDRHKKALGFLIAIPVIVLVGALIFWATRPGDNDEGQAGAKGAGGTQNEAVGQVGDEGGRAGAESPTAVLVNLATLRPGAKIAIARLDPSSGKPDESTVIRLEKPTPTNVWLDPGMYCVEVVHPSFTFQHVYRSVPSNTAAVPSRYKHRRWSVSPGNEREISWPMIEVVQPDTEFLRLSEIPAGSFTTGWTEHLFEPARTIQMRAFQMMTYEMSIGLYSSYRSDLPLDWPTDQLPYPEAGDPVRFVRFDEAIECLEDFGLRLPTREEFDYVFTNMGETEFPGGEAIDLSSGWKFGTVDRDELSATTDPRISPPVVGLSGNVLEWTSSIPQAYLPDGSLDVPDDILASQWRLQRLVRGGPPEVVQGELSPGDSIEPVASRAPWVSRSHPMMKAAAGLGFRGVRDVEPRWLK